MTPALLTAAAVVAIMGLPALYNWLTRPKRPEGWNRYEPPPAATWPDNAAALLWADLVARHRANTRADAFLARLERDAKADQETALQDLMTSINGRFTSRSEEPDDA